MAQVAQDTVPGRPRDSTQSTTGSSQSKLDIRSTLRISTLNFLIISKMCYSEEIVSSCHTFPDQYRWNNKGANLREHRVSLDQYIMYHCGTPAVQTAQKELFCLLTTESLLVKERTVSNWLYTTQTRTPDHDCNLRADRESSIANKDSFYNQLEPLASSTPYELIVIFSDFKVMTGISRTDYESVVSNFSSGGINDNSTRRLCIGVLINLAVVEFLRMRDIHRSTWISNHGHTKKEIDRILANDSTLFT